MKQETKGGVEEVASEDDTSTTLTQAQPFGVSSTAHAFHIRLQRLKKEQEAELSAAERESRIRHVAMINSLIMIRKSLRDVTRIDLGARFSLLIAEDDWNGWPRLTVKLTDCECDHEDFPFLRISAHDRQGRGIIEIEFDAKAQMESISAASEQDLQRLPTTMRRCVRRFLDIVGESILAAERFSKSNKREQKIEIKAAGESTSKAPVIEADVYGDEVAGHDIFEPLPQLDEIEELPNSIYCNILNDPIED